MNENSGINNVKLKLESLAPPGIKGELVFLYLTKDEKKENDQEKFKDISSRQFIVKAQLSKNSYIYEESLQASVNEMNGNSFLKVPEYVLYSKVKTAEGEFNCLQNDVNELSGIEFHCIACSLQEAKSKFHKVVTPFIDHLSYQANCPIHIPLISSEDLKNRCIMINYTSPYPIAKLNPHESHLDTKMLPIYALYREAKNSDSCYYKFLCYYKILEGIYNHLRPEMYKKAREKNIEIQSQKEAVPDHPEKMGSSLCLTLDDKREVLNIYFVLSKESFEV